jgi:hypothetical protein
VDGSGGREPAGDTVAGEDMPSATGKEPGGNESSSPRGDEKPVASSGGQPSGASDSAGVAAGEGSGEAGAQEGPTADKAKVDYARKATDMALEYLRHQQQEPDDELLKRLGWKNSDLARFIDRWQKMKSAAGRPTNGTTINRSELDDQLRSLGLRPKIGRTQRAGSSGRVADRVRDSARRSEPPAQYRQLYEEFLKKMSASRPGTPEAER